MSNKIQDKAHNSIMLITGARKQICCPRCGSEEYYRNLVFDRCNIMYDDGHVEEGDMDYSHSDHRCNECDYNKEY